MYRLKTVTILNLLWEQKVLIRRTYIPGINNATFIIVQVIYKFQIPSIYLFGKGQRIRSTETS